MWRCDHLPTLHAVESSTTWHTSEDEALAEASRLRFEGHTWVVAWFDSQGAIA